MIDVVFSEFTELLDTRGSYIFLKLFWLENRKLKIRGTSEEIISMLDLVDFIDEADLLNILRTIKECGLISAKKGEGGVIAVSINIVNKPDFAQKMSILDSLLTKQLVDQKKYEDIKRDIILRHEKKKTKEASIPTEQEKPKTSSDVDFEKPKPPRKVNPDSAPELVKFYYRLMHDIFGGQYESPNLLKEAHQLKLEMQKHNDSAEDTRKFFAFILNGAKEKDMFDKVSSMSLYSRLRPTAYQRIIVEKNVKYDKFMKYEDIKKSDEDLMVSMKEIYDLCVKNGTDPQDAKIQLAETFTPELAEEFFKGVLNDKKQS